MKTIIITILLFSYCAVVSAQKKPCVSKREMDEIVQRILAKRQSKQQQTTSSLTGHAFIFPLRAASNYYQPAHYFITNYVDLDPNSSGTNSTLDYNCGTRTYDTPPDFPDAPNGYEHSGIDICTGPFAWKMVDDNSVEVIAAEAGEIVEKNDGAFSRYCETGILTSGHAGNYIAIEHADGTLTFYMHMKNGSLTSKVVGQEVVAGEYLGVVASSGNSSGPHLHFETRSSTGDILDPFQDGNCAVPTGVGSLWANEEPYYNKKILSIFTLSEPPRYGACNSSGNMEFSTDTVSYQNHFNIGEAIYFSAAVRDIQNTGTVRLRILDPALIERADYLYIFTGTHNELRTLPIQTIIAPSVSGTYRLLCTYNGVTKLHLFSVGCPGSQTLSGTRATNTGVISGGSINSTEIVSSSVSNIQYQAETFIQLNPGFHAQTGGTFTARVDPCTVGGQKQK